MSPKPTMKGKMVKAAAKKMAAKAKAKVKTAVLNQKNLKALEQPDGNSRQVLQLKLEEFKKKAGGVQEFDSFMDSLNSKQAMLLWKDFERNRQAVPAARSQWSDVTSTAAGSTGLHKRKRALLHTYVKSGMKCDSNYLTMATQHVESYSQEITKKWLPWKTIEAKYGEEEALSHIRVGAIKKKRNPQNPKCPH